MLYDKYKNSFAGFKEFNVLVLNMPRHDFSKIVDISFIKDLAVVLTGIDQDKSKKIQI
jgi:hypothetical protein